MLDLGHVPSATRADVQVFSGNSATVGQCWTPWYKPRGVSMISIWGVGQGGGGGSASLGTSTTSGSGGSGIVYISVPTANYTGTTTGSPTVTTNGSFTVLKFTSSGSYTA